MTFKKPLLGDLLANIIYSRLSPECMLVRTLCVKSLWTKSKRNVDPLKKSPLWRRRKSNKSVKIFRRTSYIFLFPSSAVRFVALVHHSLSVHLFILLRRVPHTYAMCTTEYRSICLIFWIHICAFGVYLTTGTVDILILIRRESRNFKYHPAKRFPRFIYSFKLLFAR